MKRFKNILFFADGVLQAGPAIERAVALARINDARLTVIDVIDGQESSPLLQSRLGSDLNQILREHRRQMLEDMVQPFNEPDSLIYTQVLSGAPFIEVIRSVLRHRFDLVIKSARSPAGFSERLLGSTDMHLMRKCPCPVWIDGPAAALPYRRILAAVDPTGDEADNCSRLIMDLASSLAQRESAQLHVAHAWSLYGESMLRHGRARITPAGVDELIEQTRSARLAKFDALLTPYGMSANDSEAHLLKGNAATIIHELSQDLAVDLVVMGTVGRTGVPGFFIGNTAEEVLQATTTSVLAVKPANFVSPATTD
jgi:nucleotide-binding universal stress UspA family protein